MHLLRRAERPWNKNTVTKCSECSGRQEQPLHMETEDLCPAEFPSKQTKVLFTVSVTHQNTSREMCRRFSFLIKHVQKRFLLKYSALSTYLLLLLLPSLTQSKSYLAFYCQLSTSEILTVSAIQDKPLEDLTQYKTSCIMLQQRTLSLFRFNHTSVINLTNKCFITGGFLLDREKV